MSSPAPTGPVWLSRRRAELLLGALLLFFALWDVRAVLLDQRLGVTDTTSEEALRLAGALQERGAAGALDWALEAKKGPLAGVLVLGMSALVGDFLLGARLLGVLLLTATLLLLHRLTLRLSGRRDAALWAVLLCGSFPGVYGWYRTDSHDGLLATMVLATLALLCGDPLGSARRAALLGGVGALGLLAKLAYPLFVLGPGAAYLLLRVRGRRPWIRLGLALAVTLVGVGWWLLGRGGGTVTAYLQASSQNVDETSWTRLVGYATAIPGSGPLLLGGALGGWVAWRRGLLSALPLGLLLLSAGGGAALLVLVFDSWARYLVPAYPPAALLLGLSLAAVGDGLRARAPALSRIAARLLAGALLLLYLAVNLGGLLQPGDERESGSGLVYPDPTPHRAYPEALAYLRAHGLAPVELPGANTLTELQPTGLTDLWHSRGHTSRELDPRKAAARLRRGRPVVLLLALDAWDPQPLRSRLARLKPHAPEQAPLLRRLRQATPTPLFSATDPTGLTYAVVRFDP